MFKVITNHPVAEDTDDHKHPEGIYYDNNYNAGFVESFENYFNGRKLNIMDLGCAGGELICRLNERGHTAVGLEGSDHCLVIRPEMVEEVGFMPAGHKNWEQYGNKNLFTCDVTKPFTVTFNDENFKCDFITCWDVIEHFYDEQLDQFFNNVNNHLEDGGMFTCSIHMGVSPRHNSSKNTPHGLDYHKSKHPREWWIEELSKHFKLLENYPFVVSNRGLPAHHSDLFACTKL